MLTIVGIILLLVWLVDYAVQLTAGSLVHLLLLFEAISFGLDFLRSRSGAPPELGSSSPQGAPPPLDARGSLASRSRSQPPKFLAT